MIPIAQFQINNGMHLDFVRQLVWEYFEWGNDICIKNYGYNFDIKGMFKNFLDELPKYLPPEGRLYIASKKDSALGLGGFKKISVDTAELKRLYVSYLFRGNNIGSHIVKKLIEDAKDQGYKKMKLESARFMKTANELYRSLGFQEIDIYDGVETPKEYQSIIYCMELDLENSKI